MNTCGHCGGFELARKRGKALPRSTFGSPEAIIERGTAVLAAQTERLGESIARAVHGLTSAKQINAAIKRAGREWNSARMARPLEVELNHGQWLGALDADFEARTNRPVAVPSFAALHAPILLAPYDKSTDPAFATRPVKDAREQFERRGAVTRPVYDAMTDAARRRAVTVAGAATDDIVRTVQRELVQQVSQGADLRDFKKRVVPRLEQAGWTPVNPSHAENVLRTNVSTAYNAGRYRQMTQPTVLRFRPYWQIVTVNDGPPRQRKTHQAAHLVVLRADDPFWLKAYPPFGFQCRCRVRSLSEREGGPLVVSGSTIQDLPDPGFTSGISNLDVPPPQMPPANDTLPPPANDTLPPPAEVAERMAYESILERHVEKVNVVGEDAQRLLPDVVRQLDEVGFSKLYGDSGKVSHFTLSDRTGNIFEGGENTTVIPEGSSGAHLRGFKGTGYFGVLTDQKAAAKAARGYDVSKFKGKTGDAVAWDVAGHAKTADEYIRLNAVHEFGHAVHNANIGSRELQNRVHDVVNEAYKAEVNRVLYDDDAWITRYAGANEHEFFAESFAFYHYDRAELRRRSQTAFDMVRAVLKLRGLE